MDRPLAQLDALTSSFDRLSFREKVMVLSLAGTFLLIVMVAVIVTVRSRIETRDKRVNTKIENLKQVYAMQGKVVAARAAEQSQLDTLRRSGETRLFPFMEEMAGQAGVAIGDMKERTQKLADGRVEEVSAQAQLDNVTWTQVTRLLDAIGSTDKVVKVTKLRLQRRPFNTGEQLNTNITVSTYRLLEAAPPAGAPGAAPPPVPGARVQVPPVAPIPLDDDNE
jgi:Tfp pilus assembly protein PilO